MTSNRSLAVRLENLEKKKVTPIKIVLWREEHEPPFNQGGLCEYWKNKIQIHCNTEQIDQNTAQVLCFQWMDENNTFLQTPHS